MSVWLTIPSKRRPEEAEKCLAAWRERGYHLALFVDLSEKFPERHCYRFDPQPEGKGILIADDYPGYAQAVNRLISNVMAFDQTAAWFVTGGDDVFPDPNHTAEEIAQQCVGHFTHRHYGNESHHAAEIGPLSTFGVMQPTGDRWGDKRGAYIDRVCGSPWMGREFCRRINQGNGPLWPEYFHMGEDEELQHVALKYGVLWQRPDLTHHHEHWGRKNALRADMPEFLAKANSLAEWNKYKEIFQRRQAAGFPGSEPIA